MPPIATLYSHEQIISSLPVGSFALHYSQQFTGECSEFSLMETALTTTVLLHELHIDLLKLYIYIYIYII